jgi:hypothetical protein
MMGSLCLVLRVLIILMMLLLQQQTFAWSALRKRTRVSRLLSWQGISHSSSDHVSHVVAGDDNPTVEQAIAANLKLPWIESETIPVYSNQLSPRNLLQLGAVWYMKRGG